MYLVANGVFIFSYRYVQRVFKTTVIFLLLFYLIVPVFVKTNPWIQTKIIFLNNCKYPKNEPPHDKTNKMTCAHSEDSDQPGHPPSLITVFAVRMKKAWVFSCPLSTQ